MKNNKFRAWEKLEKIMYSSVHEGIYIDPDEYLSFEDLLELDRYVIMQYTGLKDKNGTEIYEGDIEADEYGNLAVVKYLKKYGAYCFVPIDLYKHENYEEAVIYHYGYDCFFHNAIPSVNSEVVGNIFENRELVEVIE